MFRAIHTVLILFISLNIVFSQNYYQYGITQRFVFNDFRTNDSLNFSKIYPRSLEIAFSRAINKNFSIGFPIRVGLSKELEGASPKAYFATDLAFISELPHEKWIPYLSIGVSNQYLDKKWSQGVPIFTGINIHIDKSVFLNLQGGVRIPLIKGMDKNISQHYGLGLNIRLGKKKSANMPIPQSSILTEADSLLKYSDEFVLHKKERLYEMSNLEEESINTYTIVENIDDIEIKATREDTLKELQNSSKLKIRELHTIYFKFDKSIIPPQYFSTLDTLTTTLISNPNIIAEIKGFTDDIGSKKYNEWLSAKRAQSCIQYFQAQGVNTFQLKMGAAVRPLSVPKRERAKYRKVDIVLTEQ